MTQHDIKTWPPFYQMSLDEDKPFELRKNDRNYKVGDILWSREWDPRKKDYTGRAAKYKVKSLVEKDPWGFLTPGTCCMGLSKPFDIVEL